MALDGLARELPVLYSIDFSRNPGVAPMLRIARASISTGRVVILKVRLPAGGMQPASGLLICLATPAQRASRQCAHRAGQCPGDPGDGLDLRDHEPAEIVDVFGLGPDDHVVGPGYVLCLGDPGHGADVHGDFGRPSADLCLNEDVRLHHAVLPGTSGMATPPRTGRPRGRRGR